MRHCPWNELYYDIAKTKVIIWCFSNFQLDQKELELNHQKKEQKRTHKKFITQISQERNANTELSERLKEQEEERVRLNLN